METSYVSDMIAEENAISYATDTYTIFVVEDSDMYRMILTRALQRLTNSDLNNKPNCVIHSYASGEDCLRDLEKKPDIVVLDYFLNGNNPDAMDGLQLVKLIKQQSPNTEVLVLSEQKDVLIAAELMRQGATSYIAKEPQGSNRIQNAIIGIIKKIKKQRIAKRNQAVLAIILLLLGLVSFVTLI